MSLSNCRFYEEKYPEVESFVMVNVKQVGSQATYLTCKLTRRRMADMGVIMF
jgi:hypothetical protein